MIVTDSKVTAAMKAASIPAFCSICSSKINETNTVRFVSYCTPHEFGKTSDAVVWKKEQTKINITFARWRDFITFWCDRFYCGFVHFESSQPSRADCLLQKCSGLLVGHHSIKGHFNHHRKRTFPVIHRNNFTGVHFEDWNWTTTKRFRWRCWRQFLLQCS